MAGPSVSGEQVGVNVPLLPRGDQHEDGWEDEIEVEAKLVKTLKERMRPFGILYLLARVIQNTIPIAALFGFREALALSPMQFSTVVAAYIIGKIPAILVSEVFGRQLERWPTIGPAAAVALGFITILTGFTTNFAQIFLVRCASGFLASTMIMCNNRTHQTWHKPKGGLPQPALYSIPLIVIIGLVEAAAVLYQPFVGQGPAQWKFMFYLLGIQMLAVALYAWYRAPGCPDTATWPSYSERQLVSKWKSERDQRAQRRQPIEPHPAEGDDNAVRWYSPILPYVKILYIAVCQMFFWTAKSVEWFWPLIFVGYLDIENPGPQTLLQCSAPWILPGCIMMLYRWYWGKLMHKPAGLFFILMDLTGRLCFLVAVVGWGLVVWAHRGLQSLPLFMVTLVYVGDIPYDQAFRIGISGILKSAIPWKQASAIRFLGFCCIAGEILGCYGWNARGDSFGQGLANIYLSSVASGLGVFSLCSKELAYALKRPGERRESQGQESDMEMVQGSSNV
ncbi:hypothetical protein NEOLEDRAFT_1133684 [Neolentinus lepideus HHB14362 ss-1]|uniref:MFS general substrate transporter n=1 Tax=Neolentinus lepideus HHB14362 ss-1 TaxID=1314782 RepID=A0A165SKW3_9AGAM|nr:hypothetical protein NEOLEDRAFT_1133684 [Neolentinus lepideus HHB14362 ss-1]